MSEVLAQKLTIFSQVKVQHIPPIDQHESRLQQVVSIAAPSCDVQKQIQLGGCGNVVQRLHGKKLGSGVGVEQHRQLQSRQRLMALCLHTAARFQHFGLDIPAIDWWAGAV